MPLVPTCCRRLRKQVWHQPAADTHLQFSNSPSRNASSGAQSQASRTDFCSLAWNSKGWKFMGVHGASKLNSAFRHRYAEKPTWGRKKKKTWAAWQFSVTGINGPHKNSPALTETENNMERQNGSPCLQLKMKATMEKRGRTRELANEREFSFT